MIAVSVNPQERRMKGYVVRWKIRDDNQIIDYWFSSSPRDGATWPTRESAGDHMQEFNRKGVTIPSSFGKVLLVSGNEKTADLLKDAHERGHDFDILAKPVHPTVIIDRLKAMSVLN
ncbi:MAG TPA: hypothetical protein VK578_16555 [Edaphobacter sp.]|nr:hypothetical protein [Edaphobacter sp.]